MQSYMKTLTASVAATRVYYEHYAEKAVADANKQTLVKGLYVASQAVRDGKQELEDLGRNISACNRRREEAQKKFAQAEVELTAIQEEKGGMQAFETYYGRATLRCPEDSVNAIEIRIEELEIELSNVIENREIVKRYEVAQRDLLALNAELDALKNDLSTEVEKNQKRMVQWMDSIQIVAKRLDLSFKHFMGELQYKGAVNSTEPM